MQRSWGQYQSHSMQDVDLREPGGSYYLMQQP
jgi:hypothetical protein